MVTKTGVGYFVSATEFEKYLKMRDLLPSARFAWEMPVAPWRNGKSRGIGAARTSTLWWRNEAWERPSRGS
jgi:hypothetical protein